MLAVVMMVFTAAPASAAVDPSSLAKAPNTGDVSAQAFRVLRNVGLSSGLCLANHHPDVFLFGGCTGQYADQYWQWFPNGQIQNGHSGACLTMHPGGRVFTHPCVPRYDDQFWRNYNGIAGMIENVFHPGWCVAAHADGNVFGFPCTSAYNDQYWYWTN
ncbi:ricin-type beta-trefoil lectin domain protein [Lentzea tibetensis]|uniref:ricin-type beta-trefoil lectin domain protein n=1 Tax=Lentzea tibetensis TaxID=2591470 RepID=UPI001648ADFA|nr:ricin-type beta-trefoil lectin domain protein [Lentzea tibetensis]